MTIDAHLFQKLLDAFKLEQLFNELCWDHASLKPQQLTINGEAFTLTAVAQKRGARLHLNGRISRQVVAPNTGCRDDPSKSTCRRSNAKEGGRRGRTHRK